ncbi:MAG: TonB-dependent receptor [Nitrospirae bacterium]|nr:TonB-dependent receptor [Nitrospirota bacterium]
MKITSSLHLATRYAFIFLLLFLLSGSAHADSCSDWIAKLDSFHGKVQTKRASSIEWKQVSQKDSFCAGDMLRVMEKSRAVVVLKNDTVMRLDQNTTITIAEASIQQKPSLLDLLRGAAYFISRTPQKFRINTPFLNAGVEGTEFLVSVQEGEASVSVFEGAVLAENSAGSIMLGAGQTASAEAGKAPALKIVARPKNAVQWTLYYPLITSGIEKQPEISAAAGLLSAGRALEADAEIEKALRDNPSDAAALSLRAIIAVVQNEKEKALDYAKKAVAAAPNSASALIALSYAEQASFDLKAAVQSLKKAASSEPNNAIVWARLSELHLSLGERNESLTAAQKAASLAPDLSRTQTVLGFAHLARIKTDEAMAAFEKAAGLDPADPLPRLGLGLAKIRKGQLEDGRREIEIAVSLDTGNALIRSYLGKAYHEEKRDSVASDQFIMAEAADPKDPTAFFYSALQKQSANRPVEALQDLEKSMALNDNRAVYRSRLLLDEDQAARGASLARIYDDLGFQQLALSEGYKSVNADPANASAHRFLSDSYAALPRHEVARVSELLQAQLLQPVGLNPVQPHLAEPGLFILQGAGPADSGFNEYNQLFNRNRISLQMGGVAGSHSTLGDEIVVSGLHEKLSFSVGQFHYETDGFRKNNDIREDIYNVFAQVALTDRTSVQAEVRKEVRDYGDLQLRFRPDDFNAMERHESDMKTARIGFHHSFGPGSDLIGNFGYQHLATLMHDEEPGVFSFEYHTSVPDSYAGELQYILKREKLNLTSGAGYFGYERSYVLDNTLLFFDPPLTSTTIEKHNVSNMNVYIYPQINYWKNLSLTAGISTDLYKGEGFDRNQINPKLGIIWSPMPATTLRAAYFRTLERSGTSLQTIEPTQVAGFSQFFQVALGADTWTYAVGIDQKLGVGLYAGAEYARRRLSVPLLTYPAPTDPNAPPPPPVSKDFDWKESFGRAYINYAPSKCIAFTAEYLYERFSRDPDSMPDVALLKTHRFPLGINYNHPSGLKADLRATYVRQSGDIRASATAPDLASVSSAFWIMDASVSYRLPKHMGMVSITGKNLLDKSFNYRDMDPLNPVIQPGRSFFFKLTLML